MSMNHKVVEFDKKLKELCKEYGLTVRSCGCCQGPWLAEQESAEVIEDRYWPGKLQPKTKKSCPKCKNPMELEDAFWGCTHCEYEEVE